MRYWGVLGFVALLMGNVALARADEPTADTSSADCDPQCRSGFTCREGSCVRSQCTPKCRSGFLCREGECVSLCNPPCADREQCTAEGECRAKPKLSDVRWTDKPHRKPKTEDDDENGGQRKSQAQDATVARFYAGPALSVFSASGIIVTLLGATLALQASDVAQSPFFVGVRTDFLRFTDGSGWLAALELDLGLRFRFVETKTSAAGLVVGGGIGGGVAWGNVPGFAFLHLPAHIGPYFDSGTFTLEVLFGPAIMFNTAALGLFESSIEFGVRF